VADASLVIGLGFGDEGKGTIVDYLTRQRGADLVVRFNGGAQAGHNVVLPEGRHHCFSQWGSGTFAGAKTLLSRFTLINPVFALTEARHLERVGVVNPLSLLHVERTAVLTTPFHVAANRLKEIARGDGRHGSCGMGIGETEEDRVAGQPDVITARMLPDRERLRKHLVACQERKRAEVSGLKLDPSSATMQELSILEDPAVVDDTMDLFERFRAGIHLVGDSWLTDALGRPGHVVFEGAQGVLLDEWFGFHPHTTWSTCTFENALTLLKGTAVGDVQRLGVLRVFHTRHGAGPLPTESPACKKWIEDDHNVFGPWQTAFRAGVFDLVLAKYALDVVGGCDLVFTHLDKLQAGGSAPFCVRYGYGGDILIPGRRGDLRHQEVLTEMLRRSAGSLCLQPVTLRPGVTDAVLYAAHLAVELGARLVLTSWGKTHEDKKLVPPELAALVTPVFRSGTKREREGEHAL
jgi:adenylosuccinate synthase